MRPRCPIPATALRAALLLGLASLGAASTGCAQQAPDPTAPSSLPGAAPFSPALAGRLTAALAAKGPGYRPRTDLLQADDRPRFTNRLILEDSPYLIQHAHNPVDWFAWGPEAFEKARQEDKPIFLSIGYSTCHWCHVMEKESFDDVEVARLMNESFVSIKVDREQRPDVDEVYMTAVQLMTGGGGWPMSSLLTSDGKPFFGGTYFPRATFVELLQKASRAWRDQRPQLVAQAEQLAVEVARVTAASTSAATIGDDVLAGAIEASLSGHDARLGGFSGAPKFPHEPELLFLLERVLRTGDRRALAAVEISLDHMARGGIYDQVGGGFHRYSTDERWLVPHFEKMLYNQAHLARAYLGASRLTGNVLFERVARQTLDYVLRDMTSPEGAFYSATDADSEGEEGAFFVWTPAEIRAALEAPDAELAMRAFGVSDAGNFEGKNILSLAKPLPETAAALRISLADLLTRIDRIRDRLYRARERRIHPLRDEKILTEWNAMMVTALAEAGETLGERRYLEAAKRAADLLWSRNRRSDGRLWRANLAGKSSIEGSLNDYAYLVEALATLFDASDDPIWLGKARSVADTMLARFWDEAAGGFYMSEDDHGGRLLARPKSPADGATPSGNSVAVRALARLAARTGEESYRQKSQTTLATFSGQVRRQPTSFAYMLLGADELRHGSAGSLEYAASGAVRARASLGGGSTTRPVEVLLDLAPGWHVNASQPLQENLIPTRLALAQESAEVRLGQVVYPQPQTVTLGFQAEPLAVYVGEARIRTSVTVEESLDPLVIHLSLTLQACDENRCLRPEELAFEVAVADRVTPRAGPDN
ncbi:MAG: DUF255 domain-containing protein [Thermoanaerobaculia bacterium]